MDPANIFCEKQRGGLCRLHALNNFLGRQAYGDGEFAVACSQYNAEFSTQPPCETVDSVQGSQEPVFAWILRTRHFFPGYMICAAPNDVSGRLRYTLGEITLLEALRSSLYNRVFVFNEGHVWVLQYDTVSGCTFSVDSLSGPRLATIGEFTRQPTLYYYCVVPNSCVAAECAKLAGAVRAEMGDTCESVIQQLVRWNESKKLISPIESAICHFYSFLGTMPDTTPETRRQITRFDAFYKRFQNSPAQFRLLIDELPPLVLFMYKFKV
jgi:hypothetical protein